MMNTINRGQWRAFRRAWKTRCFVRLVLDGDSCSQTASGRNYNEFEV
jgi:hypothetical protein